MPAVVPCPASFRGDKWTHAIGSGIPHGAEVTIVRYHVRRRVLVEYNGTKYLTMLWCLKRRRK